MNSGIFTIFINKKPIEITEFDDETSILEKYSIQVDKKAIPNYFLFKKKVEFEPNSRIRIEDIRKDIRELDTEEFSSQLDLLNVKYEKLNKSDITLLYLITNFSEDELDILLAENKKFVNFLRSINVVTFMNLENINENITKYNNNIKKERSKIREINLRKERIFKILSKTKKVNTQDFDSDNIFIEIPVLLPNENSLECIFDNILASNKVPYILLISKGKRYVKVYKHILPPDSWIKEIEQNIDSLTNVIHLYILNTKQFSYNSKKNYSKAEWTSENRIKIFIDSKRENQAENIKANLQSSISIEHLNIEFLPEKQIGIKGTFIVDNFIFNRMIFADMILNNEIMNYFFFVDERSQTVSQKDRFWVYYKPGQNGDIDSSLTLLLTPQNDKILGNWLLVRVGKSENIQEVNAFIHVFSRILGLYQNNQNGVIDEYSKILGRESVKKLFSLWTKKEKEQVDDKKTGKRLRALKLAKPDMIKSNYTCQRARQPYFIKNKENVNQIKQLYGKHKLIEYPYKSGEYYACEPREKGEDLNSTFPGLVKNNEPSTNKDYPLIPCCWKNNQYVKETNNASPSPLMLYLQRAKKLEDKGVSRRDIHIRASKYALEEKKQVSNIYKFRPLDTKKKIDKDRFGILPYFINEIAEKSGYEYIEYFDRKTVPLLCTGVINSSDSFIHCLEYAFNEKYKLSNKIRRIEQVNKVREEWTNMKNYNLAKQELYDYSKEEIKNILSDKQQFIDPSMFISIAENYYDCNIFLYEISEENLNGKVGLPRFSQFYLFRNITSDDIQKSVFIIKRLLNEEEYDYPYQCEIIVHITNADRKEFEAVFDRNIEEENAFINEANNVLQMNNKVTLVTPFGDAKDYHPIKSSFSLFKGVESQYIDSNGKVRMIHYSNITLMTSPLPPLIIQKKSVPISKKIKTIDSKNELNKFITNYKLKIVKQDGDEVTEEIQGVWVKSLIKNSGLVYGYIPFKGKGYENIDYSSSIREDFIRVEETSELEIMKRNRKIARLLQEYSAYQFSKVLKNYKREYDEEIIRKIFVVDKDHEYEDIEEISETINSEASKTFIDYNKDKVIVPTENIEKRLVYYIKNRLLNDTPSIKKYKKRKILENFYINIEDFKNRNNELIFGDYINNSIIDSLIHWKEENSRIIENSTIHCELDKNKHEPYFFRNRILKGRLLLIQNVKEGKEQALYVSMKWMNSPKDDRINEGYDSSIEEVDNSYIIYDEDNLEKRRMYKGKEPVLYIIRYSDDSYGAILPL